MKQSKRLVSQDGTPYIVGPTLSLETEGKKKPKGIIALPHTKGPLGPAFLLDDGSHFLIGWYQMLAGVPPDDREAYVDIWREDVLKHPQIVAHVTMPASDAADMLNVTRAYVARLTREYRVRWLKLT